MSGQDHIQRLGKMKRKNDFMAKEAIKRRLEQRIALESDNMGIVSPPRECSGVNSMIESDSSNWKLSPTETGRVELISRTQFDVTTNITTSNSKCLSVYSKEK